MASKERKVYCTLKVNNKTSLPFHMDMKAEPKQLQLLLVNYQGGMQNQGTPLIYQQVILFHDFEYISPSYEDNAYISPVKHKSWQRNSNCNKISVGVNKIRKNNRIHVRYKHAIQYKCITEGVFKYVL